MNSNKSTGKTDKTDPICGMQGTIPAHGHYFCSTHCINKYEQQHNIEHKDTCPSCTTPAKKWYKVEEKNRVESNFSTLGGNNTNRDARKKSKEMILLLKPK